MSTEKRQAHEAISSALPTANDERWSEKLDRYVLDATPSLSDDDQQGRINILSTLTAIFQDWVRSVCLAKGLPEEIANAAGGQLFTSGSYRLNISEKGMDIDTICVAPKHVTREDFFDSLKAILEDHDSVENLTSVESAQVPLITFDFEDVNIDLLFASLPIDSVPDDFDINDDNVLRGVDVSTEKTLNGPRVTNLIEQLVPHFPSFLKLVRCIRLWAKRRGLYSNKMGYLGGVNCNILSAFICQLYPNAAVSTLLERFFFILGAWKWPTPIMLTPVYDAGFGYETWDPSYGGNRFHVMPILTPAYPSMNSTVSVSRQTLEVMQEEMATALEAVRGVLARDGEGWDDVFAPSDFAVAHSRYIAIEIYVQGVPDHQCGDLYRAWSSYCESRLRKLVEYLSYLPVCRLRLMPKKLPLLTVSDAQGGEGLAYLLGFDIDKYRIQGGELHLTNKITAFKEEIYATARRFGVCPEGFDHTMLRLKLRDFASWRELPDGAFASLGGREAAKAVRKKLTAARKAKEAAEAALWEAQQAAEREQQQEEQKLLDEQAQLEAQDEKVHEQTQQEQEQGAAAADADAPTVAGVKRPAAAAGGEDDDATVRKKAATGGGSDVPLQREGSIAHAEILDAPVAGGGQTPPSRPAPAKGGGGMIKLNLA